MPQVIFGNKKSQSPHSGEKPFTCKECSKAFTEAGKLKIHNRTHPGENINIFIKSGNLDDDEAG